MTATAVRAEASLTDVAAETEADSGSPSGAIMLRAAALGSIGAGVVHVAAAGSHGEHRPAAIAFALLAAVQLGWGASALRRASRGIALGGVVVGLGAVAGWALATSRGIGMIDGLDTRESVQWSDAAAAGFAAFAAAAAGSAAFLGVRGRVGAARWRARLALGAVAVAMVALVLPSVVLAGTHIHGEGVGVGGPGKSPVVAPVPYDPTKPIDLGGVEGVTPQQQARAENLVAITIVRLPRFADHLVAEAAGYRSIGDGLTGFEHFVLWNAVDDDKILDPDVPESLVYKVANGTRTLVAAMFMLRSGDTLDTVPDVGGALTQWHVHDNLCFTPGNDERLVRGLTDSLGNCRAPLVKGRQVPMLHVWITPHQCGPFAALEGVAGGRVKAGETKLCDHAHGAA